MEKDKGSYTLKKKKYYKRPTYSVDFKTFEYKFIDSESISEEIADECTEIEENGGEVLTIIYNSYPVFSSKDKKDKEEEEEYNKENDKSLLSYIENNSNFNHNHNHNSPKKKTIDIKKDLSFLYDLKDKIIKTALKADMTAVYIIFCNNRLSIKKPRTFYFYIEQANSLNLNRTLGNIAIGQINKLLIENHKHICTIMDNYRPFKKLGTLDENKIINIITFYAK